MYIMSKKCYDTSEKIDREQECVEVNYQHRNFESILEIFSVLFIPFLCNSGKKFLQISNASFFLPACFYLLGSSSIIQLYEYDFTNN